MRASMGMDMGTDDVLMAAGACIYCRSVSTCGAELLLGICVG